MKRTSVLFAAALLSLRIVSGAEGTGDKYFPLIYAVKADKNMVIDGKDTEECYRVAVPTTEFTTQRGEKVSPSSHVRAAYDDKKMYFFYDCPDLEDAEPARPGDSIELFINGDEKDRSVYYQLYVTLSGNAVVNKKMSKAEDYVREAFAFCFQRKGKGFTCEVSVNRSLFPNSENIIWRVNFNRTRPRGDGDKMFTCWSQTGGGGFHMPSRFGYMILGDRKTFMKEYYQKKADQILSKIASLSRKYPEIIPAEEVKKLDREFRAFSSALEGDPKLDDGEKLLAELEAFRMEMYQKLISGKFGK